MTVRRGMTIAGMLIGLMVLSACHHYYHYPRPYYGYGYGYKGYAHGPYPGYYYGHRGYRY